MSTINMTKMTNSKKRKKHKYPGVYPYQGGKWHVFWYDLNGSKKSIILDCTQKQASKWLENKKSFVHKIKAGLEPAPGTVKEPIKLSELWNLFSKDYKLRVKAGTIKEGSFTIYEYSYLALKEFNQAIVNKRLTDIKESDIEHFKIHQNQKLYKPDYTNTIIRNLKTIFKYAVDKELINKSPLKSASYLPTHNRDVRYLYEEEMNNLMETLNNINEKRAFEQDAKDLIMFYLHTGARAKEILSDVLKWSDIQKDTLILSSSKTESARTIRITNGMRDILSHRSKKKPGPFALGYYAAYNRVKFMLEKANIKDAAVHTLRKTAGAIYYKTNRDIFATSKFLGHSSVIVTESHYVGLIQSMEIEYANKFDLAITTSLNAGKKH